MVRRALLIGAQTYDLTGVAEDVNVMERLLADRGFTDLRVCQEAAETGYDGMKEAFRRLVAETGKGDAVVVYYAGHGSLLPLPPALRELHPGRPAHLQYLVPSDHEAGTATDFRGYLAEELTEVLRSLTTITPNVTCILDCCHSGGMVRAPGTRRLRSVRSQVPVEAGVERSVGLAAAPRLPDPDVVRLVACQRLGVAYEDERQGLFTAALARTLEDFRSQPVPWSVLIARIRDRVRQSEALQHPDAGGPSGRLPFSTDVPAHPERLPLRVHGDALRLVGGALFGLERMDRVRLVLPADGTRPGTEAEARVTAVDAADALLDPPPGVPVAPLPPGSYALPVLVHTRHRVRIEVGGPLADALRGRLASSPRLTEADDGARSLVRIRRGRLEVADSAGWLHRRAEETPGPAEVPAAARRVVGLLETIARGERLRGLTDPGPEGFPSGDLRARLEVETRPGSHDFREFRKGDGLRVGDRYRVFAAGRARTQPYVWLLGVGLSGRTSLVTHDQPSGIPMERADGQADEFVWRSGPVDIWWPEDVPAEGARPESVLLLVGDRELDLSPLAGAARHRRSEPAALSALLDAVCEGVRDSRFPDTAAALRYRVFDWHATVEPPPPPRSKQ
ncbi:caspase family protein [Streptomyces sp. LRE541]|uniref:caspase family protein n=1 Tax=Streptomyces sp. LRE541 TaxID=2931983 RepID=UPI00200E4EB7|nr:caspase family protein [Streptomyces sp. LRE541]UPZ29177.1 caspase family protein [Streptomyces sp. LRE541]